MMADSQLSDLDTPLLKVSRPVAACSRCRIAKIKCDGKLPSCSACERAGKTSSCSGATDEFARGKERSYVASLESQCERLERRLEEARSRQQNSISALNTESPSSMRNADSNSYLGVDGTQGKDASDIDDLVGDFGFLLVSPHTYLSLALNATSRDFHGITSATSFAGLLLTVVVANPLPQKKIQLPPHPEAATLIQIYFDNIYVFIPLLTETKFWASVDRVYQNNGRFATSFDHWTLRMVLAIATASKSQDANDQNSQTAKAFVHAALDYSEDVLHPGTISGIQSILLLAHYSLLDPGHFRPWYLIGMASRVATDLGIHQEQSSVSHLEQAALDVRRRTFYCVYTLDRYVSSALGRAFSISDDSVNVPFPRDVPTPITDSSHIQSDLFLRSIVPALHLFQIRRIQSVAYQDMFFNARELSPLAQSTTWERIRVAQHWFDNCLPSISERFAPLYDLELLYTFILILSPSNRSPTVSELNRILLFEYAIDFIRRVHDGINSVAISFIITYMDIERIYTIACKLVDLLRHNQNDVLLDTIPDAPPVPSSTPAPPYLDPATRKDPTRRALTCLSNARSIFEYAYRRWNIRTLLDEFNRNSPSVTSTLSRCLDEEQGQL